MLIELRSDTHTKPSHDMLKSIFLHGDHGDDCYGESSTTRELEDHCARMFKKEAALFVASGTMANLIAILANTSPGDEIVTDASYHVNVFESAQINAFAGVAMNTARTLSGILTATDIDTAIHQKYRSNVTNYPKLICLENTINTHGGKIFPIDELQQVSDYAKHSKIKIHLDGARLLNAAAATGVKPEQYASLVDTLMISLSKGLGAPFGSVLLGDNDFIIRAKKFRKWLGGGLHQAGLMAAAGLYALRSNINQLQADNEKASLLQSLLAKNIGNLVEIIPAETNILMFELNNLGITAEKFCQLARDRGVLLFPWDRSRVRAITHLNVSTDLIYKAADIICEIVIEQSQKQQPQALKVIARG